MKQVLINCGIMVCLCLSLNSCYKDVILPTVASTTPPQFVSFSNDLQPIFTSNCAISGCHVAGSQKPNLMQGSAYQGLLNGGYVNTILPARSTLYIMINGNMEIHIPSASDRQKIYDWIRNGAPNN